MDGHLKREDSSDEEDDPIVMDPTKKPYNSSQTIQFMGNDERNSAELTSQNVTIISSNGQHESGSSKIKMKNIIDFSWENRYYPGNLVALHVGGKYLAYAIKPVGSPGGVVRVVSRETNARRLLTKMDAVVQDLAFAHVPNRLILACVDETGMLFVFNVREEKQGIVYSLMTHLVPGPDPSGPVASHRIFWCPFTPEDDDLKKVPFEVDAGKLLCVTQGRRAHLINVGMISEKFGPKKLDPSMLKASHGYLEIFEHSRPIVDAAFSPDGTAISTASQDGYVKFFQVDMSHKSPIRCLHQWQPHGVGKPLSALLFVDNHKIFETEPDTQFWKFVITGADNNTELKLWSCESWSCLQTLHFTQPTSKPRSHLKICMDLGGDYLLLSDIHNKLLYVLQLYRYPEPYQKVAYVCSVTELLLPCSILTFAIADAGIRRYKSNSFEDLSNDEGDEDVSPARQALVVRMFHIQPKSLQDCTVAFMPPALEDFPVQEDQLGALTHNSLIFEDVLGDSSSVDEAMAGLDLSHGAGITLLAPGAFTSPSAADSPQLPRLLDAALSASPGLSPCPVRLPDEEDVPLTTQDRFSRGEGFASGGSSPSREVQEILSLNNSEHATATSLYFEDKTGDVAQASLHLMPTPPAEPEEPDDMLGNGKDAERWPPIPIGLVNDARNSLGEPGSTNRRSLGAHKPAVKVLVSPIDIPHITEETLYDFFSTGDATPNSIYINPIDSNSSMTRTSAVLGFDNLSEAESVVREFNLKSPHCWHVHLVGHESRHAPNSDHREFSTTDNLLTTSFGKATQDGGGDTSVKNMNGEGQESMRSLENKMATMMDLLHQQSTMIKQLSSEVSSLRKQSTDREKTHRGDKNLLAAVEKLLTKSRNEAAVQFQEHLATRGEADRERLEQAVLLSVSQIVNSFVTTRLPGQVGQEVHAVIAPHLAQTVLKSVEQVQSKLLQDMTHQISALDRHIMAQVSSMIHGKQMVDLLTASAVQAMRPATKECFSETYSSAILPRFEQACSAMFKQIHDTFSRGTHEFVQGLEVQAKKHQHQQDATHKMAQQLQLLSEAVSTGNDRLQIKIGQDVSVQLAKGLSNVTETMGRVVRDQVTRCFERQQAVIESKVLEAVRCITPAPHVIDAQTQILQLVAQGDINQAFQMALSAADLSLVVLVCEKVDPDTLFSEPPCPLQQNVLLSLIQQLSADMSQHSDTKHKYLLEAVMNLDLSNAETGGHVPTVIARLQQQLNAYIASSANPKMTSRVKQLLFSTRALLHS